MRETCARGGRAPELQDDGAFQPEKKLFGFHAAGISDKRAIGPEDAVTGNDDRQGIRAVGASHRLGRLRDARALGKILVGDSAAVRNFGEFVPDAYLKRGSDQVDRAGKFGEPSVEKTGELVDDVLVAGPVVGDRLGIKILLQPVEKVLAGLLRNADLADSILRAGRARAAKNPSSLRAEIGCRTPGASVIEAPP